MVEDAERDGVLKGGDTIIEPIQGIQVCTQLTQSLFILASMQALVRGGTTAAVDTV